MSSFRAIDPEACTFPTRNIHSVFRRFRANTFAQSRSTRDVRSMVVSPGVADSCSGLQYRTTHMSTRRILWVAALLGAISAPVFAQTPQPSKPAAPAVTTPAKPANPTTPAPVVNKINLNTATATALDPLPQIGPARAKAIVEARVKGKFKNWDDFVARKVVPANAEAAIKDLVSF